MANHKHGDQSSLDNMHVLIIENDPYPQKGTISRHMKHTENIATTFDLLVKFQGFLSRFASKVPLILISIQSGICYSS